MLLENTSDGRVSRLLSLISLDDECVSHLDGKKFTQEEFLELDEIRERVRGDRGDFV